MPDIVNSETTGSHSTGPIPLTNPMVATVLLVDDSSSSRRGLKRILQTDFAVACVDSADEALRFLSHNQVQAVITDWDMPGHSGLWLLEQIKTRYPRIQRILVSGGDQGRFERLVPKGLVHLFFAKPVENTIFLKALRSL